MDWPEALALVIERTRHERWRALCAEDHPDREFHRAKVLALALATGKPADYPGIAAMAGNLLAAAGRVVGAVATRAPVLVPDAVLAERKRLCVACPQFDEAAGRCRLCGCWTDQKLRLATERCPIEPPRWTTWTESHDEA